ncbi:hypothetical protein TNIN_381751 [Trichonephila inaurata madagascariensis]|uniref:Uncharacterized protein n=1 Tax=Trichonephila inaurata madagascariensis TaxID=2747483 RepID=A0A8X7BPA8_9ARAC|nr:hypothetical protein TNIN_381751 [Trichonephila inaurata madagascariensis]
MRPRSERKGSHWTTCSTGLVYINLQTGGRRAKVGGWQNDHALWKPATSFLVWPDMFLHLSPISKNKMTVSDLVSFLVVQLSSPSPHFTIREHNFQFIDGVRLF